MTVYKVGALEVDSTELGGPTEVLLSGANSVFAPIATSGPKPGNAAIDVQAAIVVAQANNNNYFQSSVASITVANNATSFAVDATMSVTPIVGTYAIWYNADVETDGVNTQGDIELFVDGVGLGESLRSIQTSTAILGLITLSSATIQAPISIVDKYSFNGSQVLTVRHRINPATSGQGGMTIRARTILLIQVS